MSLNLNKNTKYFLTSTMMYGFSYSVWDLFFNLYILSLGFSNEILGLIRMVTPLAALILGLPLGLLTDRIGRRTSMILGLVVGFGGMILEVHLTQPGWIIFFGLLQGAGIMLYLIAQAPYIMSASKKENQAMIFSLNFGLMTLAATIGNLVGGQVPGLLEKWIGLTQGTAASYRWVISAGIVLAATSLIPILLMEETGTQSAANARDIPLKQLIRKIASRRVVRQLGLINLVTGLGAAILIPYFNVFLKSKFEISDNLLGLVFSLSSLFVFFGSLLAPWMAKVSRSRIIPIVFTQSISLIFLFTLGFVPFLFVAAISLLLRNVLMQSVSPLLDNFAMLVSPPEEQGTVASIRGIAWQAGQTAGLFISGVVQTRYGFTPLFITTGILYALGAFLTWIYFRPLEKELPDGLPAA
ncbi:MAG: MFS transporter [Anaerolineaceae bacterium]|nr:MFS transporter [Anaerolineaceae bacterium]